MCLRQAQTKNDTSGWKALSIMLHCSLLCWWLTLCHFLAWLSSLLFNIEVSVNSYHTVPQKIVLLMMCLWLGGFSSLALIYIILLCASGCLFADENAVSMPWYIRLMRSEDVLEDNAFIQRNWRYFEA